MKGSTILAAALMLTATLLAVVPAAESASSLRVVAFGDTSATSAAQTNVKGAIADGAITWIGLGDYNYDYSVATWKSMFAPLTKKYLAAGNHDDTGALAEFFPQGTRWSQSVNGVRIVAINGNAGIDTTRLRSDLCNAPESIRVLISHQNWWLGSSAHHPGTEFPAAASTMDAIVKDCGVDLVLAGHEHNYQRMMRNNIPYVIAGTGGRGLYPVAGSPSGTVASCACLGRLVMDISATGISAQFKALDGSVKDTFASGASAPLPSPSPSPSPSGANTFTPKGGNEWWVQVAVGGAVAGVDARDTGGAWIPLAKKSWGDWAASFHVEPGHDVQYRARTSTGTITESCWYDHPVARCVSGSTTTTTTTTTTTSTSTFTASFKNVRGNTWWVESDVTVSGATLARVEAQADGGTWTALTKQSYGSWAKSIHATSTVTFRAVATDGRMATSGVYAWPPG